MKNKILLAVSLALSALSVTAALPDPINVFGVSTTNGGTTLSWAIVSPRSANNGTPVVTSVDAVTDAPNTAVLQTYMAIETAVTCTFTNSTVSIPITSTNTGTKWDTGTIVIWHKLYDTCEKRTLTTSGGATNLQVTAAPWTAVTPGDLIYKVTSTGAPALTLTTNTIAANRMAIQRANTSGLLVGQKGKPLLIEISGTASTAASVYNASGYYAP